MKVEIDFDNKVIKVGQKCNFKDLMKFVKTLPNWEDYEMDASTEIVWGNSPIIIERPYRYPHNPFVWTNMHISNTTKLYNDISPHETTGQLGLRQFELNT